MRKFLRSTALGACLILTGISWVQAALIVNPDFVRQGNYNQVGNFNQTAGIHTTGWDPAAGVSGGDEFRQYLVFDLGLLGIDDPIIQARLVLTLAPSGYESADDEEPLQVYEVDTDPNDLGTVSGDPNGKAIYTDLGDGAAYSEVTVVDRPTGDVEVVIDLNAAALSALQSATGQFAFGIVLTDMKFETGSHCIYQECRELLFLGGTSPAVLEISVEPVPTPAPLALLVTGLVGLPLHLRRRKPLPCRTGS